MSSVNPDNQLHNIINGIRDTNKRVQYTTDKGYEAVDKKGRKGNQSTIETLKNVDAFVQENAGKFNADDLSKLHRAIQTRKQHLEKKQRGFFFRLFASGKTWDKISKALTALDTLDTHVQDAKTSERVQTAARGAGALPPAAPKTESTTAEVKPPAADTSAAPIGGGAPPPPPPPMAKMRSQLHRNVMKTADQPRFKGEPSPPKLLGKDHDLGKPEKLSEKDKTGYQSAIRSYLEDLDETIALVQGKENQKAEYLKQKDDLQGVNQRLSEDRALLKVADTDIEEHKGQLEEGIDIFVPEKGKNGPILLQFYADASKAPSEKWTAETLIKTEENARTELAEDIAKAEKEAKAHENRMQELQKQNLGIEFDKWDSALKEKVQGRKFWQLVLDKIEGKKTSPKVSPRKAETKVIKEPKTAAERLKYYEQEIGPMRWAGWSLDKSRLDDWRAKTK